MPLSRTPPAPAIAALLALAMAPMPAGADEPDTLQWLPAGSLYRPYLADSQENQLSVELMRFAATDIPDSGDERFGLRLGGQLGLVRGQSADGAWQLSVEAGFAGQFDNDANQDNIGWDGRYGLALEWRGSEALAGKLFALHTSSHIGDELIERVGQLRINYTREELGAALSWRPAPRWRTYTEAAWAYDLRNPALQEPWRAQAGLEYRRDRALWRGRLGWYAAADLSAMQERDWRVDKALALGLVLPGRARELRLDLHYIDGRPFMGEFFQSTEQSVSLRLATDL